MIILGGSIISDRMRTYLVESQQPVLDSPMSRKLKNQGFDIAIVSEEEAVSRIDGGERVYAVSENSLPWVREHVHEQDILEGIEVFKDKERLRQRLKPLFTDYAFEAHDVEELMSMDYPADLAPFVLKPCKGFLSMGVHVVRDENDWNEALEDIRSHHEEWTARYGHGVVLANRFILESLIEGTEYALDAYFDEEGQVRLLDILRHDFSGPDDTSDRLYVTSAKIMQEEGPIMRRFLQQANGLLAACNFPVHAEVRVKDGVVRPIEFNPLRFAGMGSTEISTFAYGFFTFDHYLHNTYPHWKDIHEKDDGSLYCLTVINAPADTPADARFDYEAFRAHFSHVLALEEFDYARKGVFGVMFWKTDPDDSTERDWLLANDLSEFVLK